MFVRSSNDSQDQQTGDSELWEALRSGRRQALDQLFRTHYPHLYHYGLKLSADPELTRDGIQELFITLWNSRHSLSEAFSVKAYLLTSLRRILLRTIQTRQNARRRSTEYTEMQLRPQLTAEDFIIHRETEHQRQALLQDALDTLTDRQLEILYLRFYNGLSNGEIASVLDINNQSVRNHLSRALGRLKEAVFSEKR